MAVESEGYYIKKAPFKGVWTFPLEDNKYKRIRN